MTLRIFSYGGGVQSTAALVLAAQGRIDFPVFLFANVGDDSEHPATLRYVREVAVPYAEQHGIEYYELRYTKRDGSQPTVYSEVMRPDNKSTDIPMRMGSGKAAGMPLKRICTNDFKIDVVGRWLKAQGATQSTPAIIGLGISLDEFERARTDDPTRPYRRIEYPLLDLRLTRQDCINIIATAGLPVPPKSSCFFCPFHSLTEWRRLKEREPELFERAAEMERVVNTKRAALGMGPVYMTRLIVPLEQAIQGTQHELDFDDACESGFCMT